MFRFFDTAKLMIFVDIGKFHAEISRWGCKLMQRARMGRGPKSLDTASNCQQRGEEL